MNEWMNEKHDKEVNDSEIITVCNLSIYIYIYIYILIQQTKCVNYFVAQSPNNSVAASFLPIEAFISFQLFNFTLSLVSELITSFTHPSYDD